MKCASTALMGKPVAVGGAAILALTVAAGFTPAAQAAGTLEIDDTRWVSVGAGLRTSFRAVEDAAASGDDYSKDFEVENIRLYVNGQAHRYVKLTFNTEREPNSNVRILDVIGRLEFSDTMNFWVGRFLPPSDRSNLDGPFYLSTWDFPFVQAYPAIFAGRDDGAAFWGQIQGGQFKYQVGAFQGRDDEPNDEDNLLYAGRLTLNLWDPEPGYFNSSTYYGDKDIFAIGLVGMFQEDGAGTAANAGDFTGWSVDVLIEKNLGGTGVATLEGAYYNYDLDDVSDPSLVQGESFFVLGAWLFPQKIGFGRFQPHVRYQHFDRDETNAVGSRGDRERIDFGVNYIISGHDARISVVYSKEDDDATGGDSIDSVLVGVQIQI